ncbi:hypothetical protein A8C56_11170 [Niabella ginsenosidivorans]|uniref:ABC transporter permease n=1 Tax=Niabella ginsenosidivorans TaxID=1176587 RepID=A0A1A9I1G6_9BACT|nr:ABC transporter permease [Niabella ginsenosidivorans]ANH81466.1 hypothetical protein A8C56_11170 [Niabella ginsenosidivorans]
MFKSYFKIAWRNLVRNRTYTIINVIGLSMGIASAILIFCFESYHLSFDGFYRDKDRIYRIVSKTSYETDDYSQGIPQPIGKAISNDYPFFDAVAMRISRSDELVSVIKNNDRQKFEEAIAYVAPDYFTIFNLPFVNGTVPSKLSEPNTAILTQSMASKLFGNDNPIGKTFTIANKYTCNVVGLLKDIPVNTDNQQQIYVSYTTFKAVNPWLVSDSSWGAISSNVQCFVKLKKNVKAADVEKAFPGLIEKYAPANKAFFTFYMQPLSEIHFDTRYDGAVQKKYLWALSIVGVFLIITACINFINLSTAQSLTRSKEIGVRKTLGSTRFQVFLQFMRETALIVLIAVVLSVLIAWLAIPAVNHLFSISISRAFLYSPSFIFFGLLLFISVSVFAGYYPGWLLSKFQPVIALKGGIAQKQVGSFSLRKNLLIVQFVIVQVMIIIAIIITQQMRYAVRSDLGFHKEGIVQVTIPKPSPESIQALRNRFAAINGVKNITFYEYPPMSDNSSWNTVAYDNRIKDEVFQLSCKPADSSYLSMFHLQLVAGRNLYPSDTINGYLINETAVKKLGIKHPGDVIGKMLDVHGKGVIMGVVKDFYNESFHTTIDPLCFYNNTGSYHTAGIQLSLKSLKSALPAIEKVWNESFPDHIFSYSFLDKDIAKLYETETTLLQIIEVFAIVAIIIGCMGLFGLVSFIAVRKEKEIGIRKVLGADLRAVLWLFGKEFVQLIVIAFVLAAPLAWLLMHHWLQDFAYHVKIGAPVFAFCLGITAIVVMVTIGYTSLRAATANPVKALRSE